jgi:hypothetical protein
VGQSDRRRDALGLDARRDAGGGRGYGCVGPLSHVADTTSAHSATGVDITDAGSYYTSTTVEGALQEIGAGGIGGGGGGSASAGELMIASSPSTPLVFADILQNTAQDDFVYQS